VSMAEHASASPRCAASHAAWCLLRTCHRSSLPCLQRPLVNCRTRHFYQEFVTKQCCSFGLVRCSATEAAVDSPSFFPSQLRYR
jgi:hypothetical protein